MRERSHGRSALQRQKAASAYLKSKQMLPSGFARTGGDDWRGASGLTWLPPCLNEKYRQLRVDGHFEQALEHG